MSVGLSTIQSPGWGVERVCGASQSGCGGLAVGGSGLEICDTFGETECVAERWTRSAVLALEFSVIGNERSEISQAAVSSPASRLSVTSQSIGRRRSQRVN
jgi:hypothetical protein